MLKKLCATLLISAGAAAVASSAGAHHSAAMFDPNKEVTLTGTVIEFQWTNPHAWIEMMATDEAGKPVQWSVELDGPNALFRQGWKPRTIKPGDRVVIVAHPLRDGRPGGSYVSIALPDGQRLGRPPGRGAL